jgi:hypothetical protein
VQRLYKAKRRGEKSLQVCAMASHHVHSAPVYPTINSQSWIPAETKARLLEWKIRYDLMEYAVRAAPELSLDQIKGYQPRTRGSNFSIAGR